MPARQRDEAWRLAMDLWPGDNIPRDPIDCSAPSPGPDEVTHPQEALCLDPGGFDTPWPVLIHRKTQKGGEAWRVGDWRGERRESEAALRQVHCRRDIHGLEDL